MHFGSCVPAAHHALVLGCLIVEVRDQRPKGRNNEPPLPEKIVLRPTAESINHDVKTNARENGWGDKEALELESRHLVRPHSAHNKCVLIGC